MTTPLISWLEALGEAATTGCFVKLKLSKPTAAADDLKSVEVRPILIKGEQKLSFTYHHRTRDIVKNHTLAESLALLEGLLGTAFESGYLATTLGDQALSKTKAGDTITHHPATHTQAPDLSHDRAKQRLIASEGKPYLKALGVTDAHGKVRHTMQDKFRQINKYIEILDGLLRKLPTRTMLHIVDMGAGKGYLTFALYDHLVNTLKQPTQLVGVEYRADLVQQGNECAKVAGFEGLRFVQGSIADYDCTGTDVVIALHACDTATDDAIAKAIQAAASLIVVAPCCHKQIRRAMASPPPGHPLWFLLRYGTYADRLAEMITDGMRSQLMELAGYQTHLFEFIANAHTPKNVMIVASRTAAKAAQAEALQASLATTKEQFGIGYHQLERLLVR